MPLRHAVPLGLQHVFAMFVGNLTPLLIITSACGIAGGEFADLQVSLLQNAMFVAGIVTLVQLYGLGPVGGKVPIIMGTSSGFLGVFNSVAATMGGGVTAYGAMMGASILGGLFESVLGVFLKPLRKLFPPVVTGTVVLSIGLSLISVGVNSFGGGNAAKDFGSVENLLLALFVLVVILFFKHWTKGFLSSSSILVGIVAGYLAAIVMGFVLPTTGVTAEGVEFTKAWVLNWHKVAEASWFAIPKLVPVKIVFDLRAILPVIIMFIVTAVETVGDISGVMEGGMGREATDKELSGGIICDGLGSTVAACFGVLPNTSFSQNVGLVAMTKVVNRGALATGAIFLMLCGLIPKLGALISIMPQAVLGGAAVMMDAGHQGEDDPPHPDHRFRRAGRGLRHGCERQHPRQHPPVRPAHLRRERHRARRLCGDHPQLPAAAGGEVTLSLEHSKAPFRNAPKGGFVCHRTACFSRARSSASG